MSLTDEKIADIVRRVVKKTVAAGVGKDVLYAEAVQRIPPGGQLSVSAGAIVTPLARQTAMERRIELVENKDSDTSSSRSLARAKSMSPDKRRIALGADHGGFKLKEQLKAYISGMGYSIVDCGTNSTDSVDYPDYAFAVARLVSTSQCWRGIIIDGAGIGSCMTANKVPGVRAAMCYDLSTAVNSREHNNANVLTLGSGLTGESLARQIVSVWLETEFGGGRHARRVDKIDALDKRYTRQS